MQGRIAKREIQVNVVGKLNLTSWRLGGLPHAKEMVVDQMGRNGKLEKYILDTGFRIAVKGYKNANGENRTYVTFINTHNVYTLREKIRSF